MKVSLRLNLAQKGALRYLSVAMTTRSQRVSLETSAKTLQIQQFFNPTCVIGNSYLIYSMFKWK